ncbi:MAG: formate--tetrahydrofolate ligase, partial [Parvularculaceae bacterium]|nr:formate--tetrahydrofolate ligase [Parvularculaceae bacterium]
GDGPLRETGFDITVASEVMAVFCLAENLADLEARLSRIVVGRSIDGRLVTAKDLGADGAMAALLKDALNPNLVQTLEGTPALIHGGPFANIAHGCNSVVATRAALALGDYAVTEAGFGADLGAEKFVDIKCRLSGLAPSAAVLVATLRALKYQGGAAPEAVAEPNAAALGAGLASLGRHIENLSAFGLPVVVAINHFAGDAPEEHARLAAWCRERCGVEAIVCRHWAQGGEGAADLARAVVRLAEPGPASLRFAYPDAAPLAEKIEAVARKIYRAGSVAIAPQAAKALARFEKDGFGRLPVCIAKTPYSFSADETLLGAPEGHVLPVREARLSAGAGFVVAICGDVMTMPGLPKAPGAQRIHLDTDGRIEGLS